MTAPPSPSDPNLQSAQAAVIAAAPQEAPEATPRASESAIRSGRAHLRLWVLALAGLALDLWSKSWAFSKLGSREVYTVIPGMLSFRRSLNAGALFGWGKGWVPLFIVASVVALGFVLYLFASSHRRQRMLHVALAMILAGAIGNLFDRAFIIADMVHSPPGHTLIGKVVSGGGTEPLMVGDYPDGSGAQEFPADTPVQSIGVVRDFIKIDLEVADREIWPWVFNVADALLVVGVGLLLIEFWASGRRAARQKTSAATPHA